MAKQNINSKQGFTIIEVVLVLAIAGLIFLMVFVALPALQRSQRDTARRNDMSRVDTSLIQYQTNNQDTGNGDLPEPGVWTPPAANTNDAGKFMIGESEGCGKNTACQFIQRYMNSGTDSTKNTFKDPDGEYYGLTILSGASYTEPTDGIAPAGNMDHMIYVVTGAKCVGEKVQKDAPRHFAILYRLEGAGVYCIDDQ